MGRTRQAISPALRRALAVRDGGCVFPVAGSPCGRPVAWCDVHHLRARAHGGETTLSNTAVACRRHHRLLHEGGWRLTRAPDGILTAVPP
jgi:hypothetical protein